MDLAEIQKLVEAGESETRMNSAVNNAMVLHYSCAISFRRQELASQGKNRSTIRRLPTGSFAVSRGVRFRGTHHRSGGRVSGMDQRVE